MKHRRNTAKEPNSTHPVECSTFLLRHESGPFFGKNNDSPSKVVSHGLLLANPRGREMEPVRYAGIPSKAWASQFGSLTFTAFGKDFPEGGMNEAGLIIEPMTLMKTKYPPVERTPRLQFGQWMQYILDSFATVRDAVRRVSNVFPLGWTSHFLVADQEGDCATIEFLDGKPVCHTGDQLPVPAITNDSYAECLAFLGEHVGFGGGKPIPEDAGSLQNFARIAERLASYDSRSCDDPVRYGFSVLNRASSPNLTKRSTVYDIARRQVHFRTVLGGAIRMVDMRRLDFSPTAQTMMVDVGADAEGDVTASAVPLTREANMTVAHRFISHVSEYTPLGQKVDLLPVTFGEFFDGIREHAANVDL